MSTSLSTQVFPDFGATGSELGQIVGALATVVLVIAVATLLTSAVVWAIASSAGNPQAAAKARTGLLVAFGVAVVAGAAATWMNFLIQFGNTL